ncbi:MAG: phosphoglucosamine mutase [Theionarchaea archaeon]|nr:phosphoglucosamine mutase [Theionarchaea archaeon]
MLFGTAGIRGDLMKITPQFALTIGKSVAIFAERRKYDHVTVGKDGRTSSDMVAEAVKAGILSEGVPVVDGGRIPTPVLAFATDHCGIMVTASHNPPDNNGMKVFNNHRELYPQEEREIEEIVASLHSRPLWKLPGIEEVHYIPDYEKAVLAYVEKEFGTIYSGKRIVLDCGNGMGALVTPHILKKMGCDIIPLFAEVTGKFERPPEPSEKNISLLKETVLQEGADMGIAQDGDADRINVVDEKGCIISEDSIIALLAGYYVNPGDCVVTSIDTSFRIDEYVSKKGGHTKRVMLGNLHEGIPQHNAIFAGEPWKHIHIRFGTWIDGIVSTTFLAKFIVQKEASQLCSDIHEYPVEKINIKTEDRISMVNLFRNKVNDFPDIRDVATVSGIRINFSDGSWILVRPSGTEPKIRVIIEGVTPQKFELLRKFVNLTLDESKSLYSIVN